MKASSNLHKPDWLWLGSLLAVLLLFWFVLFLEIPASISQYFHFYSLGMFVVVLALFSMSFRLPGRAQTLAGLGLSMVLFALSLSYLWNSGFSDNFIMGGLLPYKDAKNYYLGAELILNGLPVVGANQATERPLFAGFLSSILFLTGQNLKISLALITQLMGVGLYLAARQVRSGFGAIAASLFATFLYFYIKPWIGYTMSETLGFAAGCLGFTLVWLIAERIKWYDLSLGLVMLLMAISARAGAFIIFPLLIIWGGWVMRGEKRFSLSWAGYALGISVIGYILINSMYAQFLGIPSDESFRNFSYALYGQVHGGIGWHSAIADLGTREPAVVYQAAWQYFLVHPADVFIGFAKAYRDFFQLGREGIFPFIDGLSGLNDLLWLGTLFLMVLGLARLFKEIRSSRSSLLLAGFLGVFLSIPFLPPIDGGTRFYASSVPFFFVIPAVGLSRLLKAKPTSSVGDAQTEIIVLRLASTGVLGLTLLLPMALYTVGYKPPHVVPACAPDQKPVVLEFHPDAYLDLIKDDTGSCGAVPELCLGDFDRNNSEKSADDFYLKILRMVGEGHTNVRIIPAFELVAERFRYFYVSHDKLPEDQKPGLLSGCVTSISTRNQLIFQVESLTPVLK